MSVFADFTIFPLGDFLHMLQRLQRLQYPQFCGYERKTESFLLPDSLYHFHLVDAEKKGEVVVCGIECAVCLQTCLLPVKLPCGHIFCYLCVKVRESTAVYSRLFSRAGPARILPRQRDHVFRPQRCLLLQYYCISCSYSL